MNLKQAMNLEYVLKKYLDQLGITEDLVIFCERNSSWKITFNDEDYVYIDEYAELQSDYDDLQESYDELEIEKEKLEDKYNQLKENYEKLIEMLDIIKDICNCDCDFYREEYCNGYDQVEDIEKVLKNFTEELREYE